MSTATTYITDYCPTAQIGEPVFQDFGGRRAFFGPARTLKVAGDNRQVREVLSQPGHFQVLVVDGGGSARCALLDAEMAALAAKNNWAGVVVNGCVRQTNELRQQRLGIKALGANPRKSECTNGGGELDAVLEFAGLTIRPGYWIYADADGIVVTEQCFRLHARAA